MGSGVNLAMNDEAPIKTPQVSMKRGLKIFREWGEMVVKKEMQQLHDHHITILGYLMFLK